MSTSQFSVSDKTAVVTGSGGGIGKSIAMHLAKDGAKVVVSDLREKTNDMEEVTKLINQANHDGSAVSLPCDVTKKSDIMELNRLTIKKFGNIDILVNNVGGGVKIPFDEVGEAEWQDDLETNLYSVYLCTKFIGENIRRNNGGSIVNIASGAGLQGRPNNIPYSVAKAGVIRMTEALAFEWAPYNVRINAIAPGLIPTQRIRNKMPELPASDEIDRDTVQRRYGKPEEIADIVQLLASRAGSFITGRTIEVSGVPHLERHLHMENSISNLSGWVDVTD